MCQPSGAAHPSTARACLPGAVWGRLGWASVGACACLHVCPPPLWREHGTWLDATMKKVSDGCNTSPFGNTCGPLHMA
jgi:hypothetical protein